MQTTRKMQLLRNGIRGALNPCTSDTDNIHACSAVFAKAIGRDTALEARNAIIEAMPPKQREVFNDRYPFGHNLMKLEGPLSKLSLESLYQGGSVAMALSAVAIKEGMNSATLRDVYPDVLTHFKDAAKLNEMRARFPELKTKHINRLIRTLALEELRADLPDVKEKKLLKAISKFEI